MNERLMIEEASAKSIESILEHFSSENQPPKPQLITTQLQCASKTTCQQ